MTVVAKRARRRRFAGNVDHTAITVNRSKARRTRQAMNTGLALTNFANIPYTGETAQLWKK